MKLSKLLLVVVGATALLVTLVATASARNLEDSSQTTRASWTRMNFSGGFGTVECEVRLTSSYHTRTMTKTINSLIGYLYEGEVTRCSRGSATVNRASLPWHIRYRSFTGTLPNITSIEGFDLGSEWTFREPTFGITCTVPRATSSMISSYTISSGGVTRADVSGSSPCGSFTGTLEGSTTNVTNGAGARLTVRLI